MAKRATPRTTLADDVRRRLDALRRDRGIPATFIADKTGLSAKWVQRYFAGSRGERPTLDQLDALCRYFNRRLSDVLLDAAPVLDLDEEDEQWLWIGRQLTAAERAQVKQLASLLRRTRALKTPRPPGGPRE